jgi:diketogulonate reductase-like aldo/keto reductase
VIAIPKASNLDKVRENAAAASIRLTAADLATINAAYTPPTKKRHLQMM